MNSIDSLLLDEKTCYSSEYQFRPQIRKYSDAIKPSDITKNYVKRAFFMMQFKFPRRYKLLNVKIE